MLFCHTYVHQDLWDINDITKKLGNLLTYNIIKYFIVKKLKEFGEI